MPDAPREWSFESKPTRQRAKTEGPRLRRARRARPLIALAAHACSNCGTDLRTPKERREIELRLEEAKRHETEDLVRSLSYRDRLEWAGGDERSLRLVERICGYKSGWAWHRMRELAAQRGSAPMAKKRNGTAENWISYPRSLVESPALRVLSRGAILVMRRIELEHMTHGGAENGNLQVTQRQFEEWGVHRDAIGPAIREITALGFAKVERGHAGVGGHGVPNRFRLT